MISWNLTEERRSTCVSPNLRLPLTSPSYSPELSSFLLRNNSVLNVSSDLEFCCCRVRAGKLRRQTRDNLHHIVRLSSHTLTTDDNQWQCFMPPVVLHPYYFTWPYFRGVGVGDHCSKPSGKILNHFHGTAIILHGAVSKNCRALTWFRLFLLTTANWNISTQHLCSQYTSGWVFHVLFPM